jgi:hypothetical protein
MARLFTAGHSHAWGSDTAGEVTSFTALTAQSALLTAPDRIRG